MRSPSCHHVSSAKLLAHKDNDNAWSSSHAAVNASRGGRGGSGQIWIEKMVINAEGCKTGVSCKFIVRIRTTEYDVMSTFCVVSYSLASNNTTFLVGEA